MPVRLSVKAISQFGDCHRNNRTGDRSRSRYAGIGIIDKIYVDYNSVVTKGQLIAEMDRVTLQSELASQQATYDGAKAEFEYQKKNYERSKGLHDKSLISDTDYEQALYNYQKAKSAFDSSKASLAKAERNLSYATITSPIDGVVISAM